MARSISNDTFSLIHTMSMAEKRHFRFYATMGSANSNKIYLRLFYLIALQKKYDERKLLKKIPRINPSHISSHKKYLTDLILESLQLYHSRKNVSSQLRAFISEIELLYNKGLISICKIRTLKAIKLARKYEKYDQLLELLKLKEKIITSSLTSIKDSSDLDTLLNERLLVAEKIIKSVRFSLLNKNILKLYREKGVIQNKLNPPALSKIISNPLMVNIKDTDALYDRYSYHQILGIYYHMTGEWHKSFLSLKEAVNTFESMPHRIPDSPSLYARSLSNFLNGCIETRKEKELEDAFSKIMKIPLYADNFNTMMIFLNGCSAMLRYYNTSGNFQRGISMVDLMNDYINQKNLVIDKFSAISFYYIFAYNNFGMKKYKVSLFWLNRILNDTEINMRNDLQIFARLLNLIIHFEMGNQMGLHYLTKSTRRIILNNNHRFKIEKVILDFFAQNLDCINSNKIFRPALRSVKAKIDKLAKDPFEIQVLKYLDFASWVDSKLTGKSFAEVVKSKW